MPIGFSKTSICNMALSHVGSKVNIESIDENIPPAKLCKMWYDAARIQTLEGFDWSFARKTALLATHAEAAPTHRYSHRYILPSDYVAARLMENPAGPAADAVAYRVENAGDGTLSLLTNLESASLVYTFDSTEVHHFTMQFTETFAIALAGRIAYKLTGKVTLVRDLRQMFAEAIMTAQISDINSSIPPEERDAATIRARS